MLGFATVPQGYQKTFVFELYYWRLWESYQSYGLVTGFVSAVQDLPVEQLDGYSDAHAEELIAEYAADYDTSGTLTPAQGDKVNEFLSCIRKSDADLAAFLEQLEELDEPVALLFFGDHQPFVSRAINDALFPNEDDFAHAERIYNTPYLIWANSEVEGRSQDSSAGRELSSNYLGLHAIEQLGVPLADTQKAELQIIELMPVVNVSGTRDAKDAWSAFGRGFAEPVVANNLACILYYRYRHELA